MKILDEQEHLREDRARVPTELALTFQFFFRFSTKNPTLGPAHEARRGAQITGALSGNRLRRRRLQRRQSQNPARNRSSRSASTRRRLRRNYGQTAAMAGRYRRGKRKSPDPDGRRSTERSGRHPPSLDKLDEGYDVVSGWRKNRKDKMITRKIPSMLANRLISWIGGVPLHDYGCSLKAYRRESLEDVRLYGEMHRFIPIYAAWAGARVTEIPVEHHARTMGKSKYGLSRTIKVVFDLMTIKFMASYQTKPIYVFGSFGLLAFAVSLFERTLRRISQGHSQS
jgi:hypothetical protein